MPFSHISSAARRNSVALRFSQSRGSYTCHAYTLAPECGKPCRLQYLQVLTRLCPGGYFKTVLHRELLPSQATPQPLTLPLPPRARHSPNPTTKWLTSHVELHPTTSLPHAYGQGCTPRHSQATHFTGSPTLASAEPGRQTHACQVRRYQATDDTERTPMQHLSRRLHCVHKG